MAVDNELLAFEDPEPNPPTSHSPIVRDDSEVLISGNRSKNADGEWEIRGYRVFGHGIIFSHLSVPQAELAAILVEEFDADSLSRSDRHRSLQPIGEGVPVAVATDGKPAIAAWLRVRGRSRSEIANLLNVGDSTVTEYLSRFRRRGTGIPDDVDAPRTGSVLPELPAEFDYSRATDGGGSGAE